MVSPSIKADLKITHALNPSLDDKIKSTLFLSGMATQARRQQFVNLPLLKRLMSVLEPFTCPLVRPVARPWCFCVYFGLLFNERVAASTYFSNFKVIKIRKQRLIVLKNNPESISTTHVFFSFLRQLRATGIQI